MKEETMLCTRCMEMRAMSMFWSVNHQRHVAACAQCRLVKEGATLLSVAPPALPPPKPAPVELPVVPRKEPSNFRLIPDAGYAACIRFVIAQLNPRHGA